MSTETKEKPTPPDFEKEYRLPTESKRQWDLRKKFIEAYWDKYDEDRLLCLARSYFLYLKMNYFERFVLECYVNMRCLGCKYSKSLDSLVEDLAKQIE